MEFGYGTGAWNLGVEKWGLGQGIQVWNLAKEFRYGTLAWNLGMELSPGIQAWRLGIEFRYGNWAQNLGMELLGMKFRY